MALNEEQQNAAIEALRLQQREELANMDRTTFRKRSRSKEYNRGFVIGSLLFGSISVLISYFVGAANSWLTIVAPFALVGGALTGWLADTRRKA